MHPPLERSTLPIFHETPATCMTRPRRKAHPGTEREARAEKPSKESVAGIERPHSVPLESFSGSGRQMAPVGERGSPRAAASVDYRHTTRHSSISRSSLDRLDPIRRETRKLRVYREQERLSHSVNVNTRSCERSERSFFRELGSKQPRKFRREVRGCGYRSKMKCSQEHRVTRDRAPSPSPLPPGGKGAGRGRRQRRNFSKYRERERE
jgi:hypothetical protein